jgi:hypothetical protein
MNLYEWETLADFNNWHDNLCTLLNYPLYPVNQLTGETDFNSQPTTTYTSYWEIENKIIAFVEQKYADGLTLTNLQPPKPER